MHHIFLCGQVLDYKNMEAETLSSLVRFTFTLYLCAGCCVALSSSQQGESYSQESLWTSMQNTEDHGN